MGGNVSKKRADKAKGKVGADADPSSSTEQEFSGHSEEAAKVEEMPTGPSKPLAQKLEDHVPRASAGNVSVCFF